MYCMSLTFVFFKFCGMFEFHYIHGTMVYYITKVGFTQFW